MIRRQPRCTRSYHLCHSTRLFRSGRGLGSPASVGGRPESCPFYVCTAGPGRHRGYPLHRVNPFHTSGEKCGKVRALSKAGITVTRGFAALDLTISYIASRYPLLTQWRTRTNGPAKTQHKLQGETNPLTAPQRILPGI